MKVQHYREMSPDELDSKLEELYTMRDVEHEKAVTEKLENSKAVSNVKHDIARIKTVMWERK